MHDMYRSKWYASIHPSPGNCDLWSHSQCSQNSDTDNYAAWQIYWSWVEATANLFEYIAVRRYEDTGAQIRSSSCKGVQPNAISLGPDARHAELKLWLTSPIIGNPNDAPLIRSSAIDPTSRSHFFSVKSILSTILLLCETVLSLYRILLPQVSAERVARIRRRFPTLESTKLEWNADRKMPALALK